MKQLAIFKQEAELQPSPAVKPLESSWTRQAECRDGRFRKRLLDCLDTLEEQLGKRGMPFKSRRLFSPVFSFGMGLNPQLWKLRCNSVSSFDYATIQRRNMEFRFPF
ncbi:MAG: hypothetical protein AW12_01805 [Candidatus Accumulibacter sp. BA-94]|nr:MAG: hypothetical protein AW12_01805 [Candidatus Accumulibacter sp. BA-94]MBL8390971.1 hypothetical protein [Accumulibacter sp.]HRD93576.1 hypothetical protein [Accumulibacter sp.]